MTAHEDLAQAIVDAARDRHLPPCSYDGGSLWASDNHHERAHAALLCRRGCPVIEQCHAAAEETSERWLVWGGIDRATTRRKAKTA